MYIDTVHRTRVLYPAGNSVTLKRNITSDLRVEFFSVVEYIRPLTSIFRKYVLLVPLQTQMYTRGDFAEYISAEELQNKYTASVVRDVNGKGLRRVSLEEFRPRLRAGWKSKRVRRPQTESFMTVPKVLFHNSSLSLSRSISFVRDQHYTWCYFSLAHPFVLFCILFSFNFRSYITTCGYKIILTLREDVPSKATLSRVSSYSQPCPIALALLRGFFAIGQQFRIGNKWVRCRS